MVSKKNGVTGSDTDTMEIASFKQTEAGSYYVVASNTAGSATSDPVVVTVIGPPVISVQPMNQFVQAGQSVTLSVGAGTGQFNYPAAVAVDASGNVYVADSGNGLIREIGPSESVSTLAPNATDFDNPQGVAVDSAGNVYVADTGHNTIQEISTTFEVTTVAGRSGVGGYLDGTGGAALFNKPEGVAVDGAGNLYVADTGNGVIREISPGGVVTTLAGEAGTSGGVDSIGLHSTFNQPAGVAVDRSGNVYVADTGNSIIREIDTSAKHMVTTFAGLHPMAAGSTNGPAASARFNEPQGIAVDGAGNLYIADTGNSLVRKISAGNVSTLAPSASFSGPKGIAADFNGNAYVADTGNLTIEEIASGGTLTTLAGTTGIVGSANQVPAYTYQWYFEASSGSAVPVAGGTGPTLTLSDSQAADAGSYHVVVSDAAGSTISSTAVVTVEGQVPVITSQPTNQTVQAGAVATFTIQTDEPWDSVQWFKGCIGFASELVGQTGTTLTLGNVQYSDSAGYYAVVTDLAGSVTSNQVYLAVIGPPVFALNSGAIGTLR